MTDEEINEFDSKFGRAYVSDESGGHYVGSYLIEFINKLLKCRQCENRLPHYCSLKCKEDSTKQ